MFLIQVSVHSLFALCKALVLLLRRPHGIDLDGPNRGNWPTGNIFEGGVDHCVHIAEKYSGAETVYVSDPRALYHMVVKDQHIFEEPNPFIMSNKLVFGEGLISAVGEQHPRQRKLLGPVFSTSNMRRLLSTLHPISDGLTSTLASKFPTDSYTSKFSHSHKTSVDTFRAAHKEIDILPRLSRCALDGVCQSILGYPSNTLSAAENDPYPEALRKIGPLIGKLMKYLLDLVTVPWLPTQFMADVRDMRRVVETIDSASRKAFSEKKVAMEAEETPDPVGAVCRDGDSVTSMMDIMLKANPMSSDTERLTDAELLGQMNVMVFASLDTTTSALARCVYLLAQHSGAQTRLRSEIRDAMKTLEEDGDMSSAELPYDVLMNLPFLDDIVKEALRLYPSLPVMAQISLHACRTTERPKQPPSLYNSPHAPGLVDTRADANEWRPERWLSSPLVAPSQAQEVYIPLSKEFLRVKDSVRFPVLAALSPTKIHLWFKFAKMESKQVLATLVLRLHFSLPTEQNTQVYVKEIQWKLQAFHIPVVKPPAGDGVTPQVPLNVRLVKKNDFIW
ncbi:cytochrome P450 [Suillus lakei]|nr:cytochrome P450 [Suillus lakei]